MSIICAEMKKQIRKDFAVWLKDQSDKRGTPLFAHISFNIYDSKKKNPHHGLQSRFAIAAEIGRDHLCFLINGKRDAGRWLAKHLGQMTSTDPAVWNKDCPGDKKAARWQAVLNWAESNPG